MGVYLFGFAISCIFTKLVEKYKSKDIRYIIGSFFAILVPCLIAGLRSDVIGTDVQAYTEPLFDLAKSSSSFTSFMSGRWYQVWRYKSVSDFEIGFTSMVYVVTKCFSSLNFVLFIIELLIVAPVYRGLMYLKSNIQPWLGMLAYYFLFFNTGLNWMRQSIGVSFLFLGFSYLLVENKLKKSIICAIVAGLFHTSSIVGIIIFALYYYLINREVDQKTVKKGTTIQVGSIRISSNTLKIFVAIVGGGLIFLSLPTLIDILQKIGLGDYSYYMNGSFYFLPNQIIIRLPIFVLIFLQWKKIKRTYKAAFFLTVMISFDLLASQIASITSQSGRIGYFFAIYEIYLIPMLVNSEHDRLKKVLIQIICISYLFIYWYYTFVFRCSHQTYPYIFGV